MVKIFVLLGLLGEYQVCTRINDQHISDSPFKLFISPAMGDAYKMEFAQFPMSRVYPYKPSEIFVNKNGAKGELDGKIVSPSGAEYDCFIHSINSDTDLVRFMPRESGLNNIHVKFNGINISGSPFLMNVYTEDYDAALVIASGAGLGDIKTGKKTDFVVDMRSAVDGILDIVIEGPGRVIIYGTEVEEGHKVHYTPLVPGLYNISVKYNCYHIFGSPFKATCTDEDLPEKIPVVASSVLFEKLHEFPKNKLSGHVLPHFNSDASKVRSKGLGLQKAYLEKNNKFLVNAQDAGNNILYVSVYGPNGPCEEVSIKHLGLNNYKIHYVIAEKGEYSLIVKWGDEHIIGSPFKVDGDYFFFSSLTSIMPKN